MRPPGNVLSHDPNLAAVASYVEPAWRSIGENVGVGDPGEQPPRRLHGLDRPPRQNTASRATTGSGVGVVMDGSKIWVTVRFLQGPAIAGSTGSSPALPPPSRGGPVTGDFNGDGFEDAFVDGAGSVADQLLLGKADQTFTVRSASVSGHYFPVAGDLDGNGTDEIVWYGWGTLHDAIWRWNGSGFSSLDYDVDGTYVPYGGDFDGDGRGDVLWYGPGSAPDRISYGTANIASFYIRTLASIGGSYRIATGDLGTGDGKTDAGPHQAGTASDALVYGAARGVLDRTDITVDGRDCPGPVGDLDGNGAEDIVWYGVGTGGDVRWQMSGVRGHFTRVSASVSGTYDPEAGDFNGDHRDDVLWFTPNSAVGDTIWWGQPTGTTSSGVLHTS